MGMSLKGALSMALPFGLGSALGGNVKDMLFGSNKSSSSSTLDPATQAYINAMRERQNTLWPTLQKYAGDQGDINKAYSGMVDKYKTMADTTGGVYDKAINDTQNFALDPTAEGFLKSLRDERINSLQTDLNNLIGTKIGDLGRRGVLSSSTAEGSMGEVAKAALPYVSQANQDYYSSRLALPGQIAGQVAGLRSAGDAGVSDLMNKGYATAQQRFSDLLQPYLQLWDRTASGAGMTNGQTTTGENPYPGMLQYFMQGAGAALPAMAGGKPK